jgi:EAL domain-containing protein (putative c-di-GMP-specific phosphodiesterase class I)
VIALPHDRGIDPLHTRIEAHLDRCTAQPFRLSDSELHIAARFGISLYPADGSDADALFQNAEAALKNAKADGERLLFYMPHMTERVAERVALENRLRGALERDEFVLYYQPKVDAVSFAVTGVEALLRWQDPHAGLVLPAKFVPLLEETGMIVEVGAWAIGRAIADHSRWMARGLAAPRVAVNVSAVQLRQRDFVDLVRDALAGSPPARMESPLDIEITESVIMKDVETNVSKLRAIHDLGVKIAIDDFGTGYSSLSYLQRFPFDKIKIDRSFIKDLAGPGASSSIVQAVVNIAAASDMMTTAEGVETEQQRNLLFILGCNEMQGHLFSPAVPDADVRRLLFSHRGKAMSAA